MNKKIAVIIIIVIRIIKSFKHWVACVICFVCARVRLWCFFEWGTGRIIEGIAYAIADINIILYYYFFWAQTSSEITIKELVAIQSLSVQFKKFSSDLLERFSGFLSRRNKTNNKIAKMMVRINHYLLNYHSFC